MQMQKKIYKKSVKLAQILNPFCPRIKGSIQFSSEKSLRRRRRTLRLEREILFQLLITDKIETGTSCEVSLRASGKEDTQREVNNLTLELMLQKLLLQPKLWSTFETHNGLFSSEKSLRRRRRTLRLEREMLFQLPITDKRVRRHCYSL